MTALHDAELIAVAIDRGANFARLDFTFESGDHRSVKLNGLKAFRCEDFTLQNVASRMLRSSTGGIQPDHIESWIVWATSLSDSKSWLTAQARREWLDACKTGALELMVLEPSAGAQVAAVCENLLID